MLCSIFSMWKVYYNLVSAPSLVIRILNPLHTALLDPGRHLNRSTYCHPEFRNTELPLSLSTPWKHIGQKVYNLACVLLTAEVVCRYKLTGLLSIIPAMSRGEYDAMLCDFHFKNRGLLMVYKQQVFCSVWRYDMQSEPKVTLHLYCIHQVNPSVNCHMS
jgi:hypothetical protein